MIKQRINLFVAEINKPGGTERAVVNLANDLSNIGYDVAIVSVFSKESNPFYALNTGIEVRHLEVIFYRSLLTRLLKGFVELRNIIASLYKEVNSEFFISTDPFISFVLGSVRVINSNNKFIACEHMAVSIASFYSKLLRRIFLKKAKVIVVLTYRDQLEIQKLLPHMRSEVIPNRISFLPEITSDCLEKNIISVGRLEKQKNYLELISIFKTIGQKYPDWRLTIIGQGSQKEILDAKIRELDLTNVISLIEQTNNIPTLLNKSSMYVMTSIFEGFPMVLLEAMACGLPVISYDCPNGPRELIEDGKNGILVELHNKRVFENAIIELIENQRKRIEFGRAGRNFVKNNLSVDCITNKWDILLKSL